jgi:hypothetical protein
MMLTIMSSVGLPQEFKVIGEKQLAFIAENMPDVYRQKEVYGRKNSQVTGKLMTLQMLRFGPYNALKQCAAQIDHKREAIKENLFKLAKTKNLIEKLEEAYKIEQDKFKLKNIELDIMKKSMDMADARVHVEHAYREMYMYLQTIKEIKAAHNIPDNFDEKDFIDAEVKENVQTAFQHCYRDVLMTGRLNVGTMEWLEQFGIEPATAFVEVQKYMASIKDNHDVTNLYAWYDEMYEKYGEEYKKAMKRLGLDKLMTDGCSYVEGEDGSL